MPSRRTLHEWAGPFSKCRCGYHNWHELYQREQAEQFPEQVKAVEAQVQQKGTPTPQDVERAASMLKEALEKRRADLGQVQDSLVTALAMLSEQGTNLNEVITGDLQFDANALAYAMLIRAIEAIRRVEVRDVYQVIQVIRGALAILNMFRPPLPEPEEIEREIEYDVSFGNPITDKPWLESGGGKQGEERDDEIQVGLEFSGALTGGSDAEAEDKD